MTKKQEKELMALFEEKLEEAKLRCTIAGFKAAYDCVVEQIDNGMSLEQIRDWVKKEKDKAEIVEKVKLG